MAGCILKNVQKMSFSEHLRGFSAEKLLFSPKIDYYYTNNYCEIMGPLKTYILSGATIFKFLRLTNQILELAYTGRYSIG